jgi:uncharacterized membrane protein (UPF0127 family)
VTVQKQDEKAKPTIMNRIIHTARQKRALTITLVALALIALAYGYRCGEEKVCGSTLANQLVRSGAVITMPNGTMLSVEVADTPASRELGLSGRKSISDDDGLLFVFDRPGRYGFWMKDMKFPIDMVWINKDGVVVYAEREIGPDTYFNYNPPKTFINGPEALYVLEVASGQSEKLGLYLGSKVKIER